MTALWCRLRAVWRLLRTVLHIFHGAAIIQWRFPSLNRQQRGQRVQWWGAKLVRLLGVQLVVEGQPWPGAKLIVGNHISWLDIMVVDAVQPMRFVSKAEVAKWPVVGAMVTAAGTLYLQRERRRDAVRVLGQIADALRSGDTVAVFPEGTTSDGTGLLPFHANMLQSAIDAQVPVQAVALRYSDAEHEVSPAVAYIGDTSLGQSLWWIASASGLRVTVRFLTPRAVVHPERRVLAAAVRNDIAQALGIAVDTADPGIDDR